MGLHSDVGVPDPISVVKRAHVPFIGGTGVKVLLVLGHLVALQELWGGHPNVRFASGRRLFKPRRQLQGHLVSFTTSILLLSLALG